ncbi:MAG TPA: phage tail protein [Acidimicrobiales bacterium]|nr:phage tail protein [Acidimicrobiales bacterium]
MSFITSDPLVATHFFLEIDGAIISQLQSVDGLSMEVEKAEFAERYTKGAFNQRVTMSKPKMTGEITLKRLAPLDATADATWKWFMEVRSGKIGTSRKNGSVVIFDAAGAEVSRWNFEHAWPSKIASDSVDVTKNDPVTETITLQYESLERKK